MKKFFKLLTLLSVAMFISSCMTGVPIVREAPRNNKTYDVDYLFEHDGYRVFRFYDKGNYVYFTTPAGTTTAIANDSTQKRVISITGNDTRK